jgi:hypothetical protein
MVKNKLEADVPSQSMSIDFEIVVPWLSKEPLSRHLIEALSAALSCAFCRVAHGLVNAQVVLLLSWPLADTHAVPTWAAAGV